MANSIEQYLKSVYDEEQASEALSAINELMDSYRDKLNSDGEISFDEKDVVLITYGDSLKEKGIAPLKSLTDFVANHLQDTLSSVHILPFYPFSSDDGFSVQDFYAVNSDLGNWDDVEALNQHTDLMFDAVFNHMSAQSDWFARFLTRDPEFKNLFLTESPDTDLSSITRPRATPLLTAFDTPYGDQVHVWTTFSADQVDFNIKEPSTLTRLLDILLFYVEKGATIIRLDAIAYLWKEVGTTSIHLEQTHTLIQLMREVLNEVAPSVILITETNVPHDENISYWGDGHNEAQMVYNFTLPPLLAYTLLSGDSTKFKAWVDTLNAPSNTTTFFNFTASHDGVGVRPVEGILEPEELQLLIDHTQKMQSNVSYKQNSDGSESPYELNITYVDMMARLDEKDNLTIRRFLLSQAVALSLAGVPAVYIHSLLGSRNDYAGVKRTGRSRSINRAQLDYRPVEATLAQPESFRAQIFHAYKYMIQTRRTSPAFHPNSAQSTIDTGNKGVFALLRGDTEKILCIYNVTQYEQEIDLSDVFDNEVMDVLANEKFAPQMTLSPYEFHWLVLE